jgi:hypothetical protein
MYSSDDDMQTPPYETMLSHALVQKLNVTYKMDYSEITCTKALIWDIEKAGTVVGTLYVTELTKYDYRCRLSTPTISEHFTIGKKDLIAEWELAMRREDF